MNRNLLSLYIGMSLQGRFCPDEAMWQRIIHANRADVACWATVGRSA